MKSIAARRLSKTYWFYEKESGLSGSIKALFQPKRVVIEAVREVDFSIDVGEVVGFIGPNGAGKTTTMKMLCGILHPSGGELNVMGFSPWQREKAFLKNITYLSGQRNRLFWDLPASEYFEFCKVVYEIPAERYKRNMSHLVEMAEIGNILKTPQRKLSFGQRKRCELVASLLHDPRVIFLDEPSNAMDIINAKKLREFIKEQGKAGERTIILTSHKNQ
jgi:ABC-2 type transport system ATP-binding protein